jgi:LPS O-antigen subunit length determinant protein (WzzB/FepE family)
VGEQIGCSNQHGRSRSQDVNEANRAIAYLRSQLEQTQLVDMQRVFYQLIESQTRITMLADVRDEYMFRVIDPATMPDQRNSPRRSLMVIIGAFAGVFLALLLAYLRRTLGFAKFADERQ